MFADAPNREAKAPAKPAPIPAANFPLAPNCNARSAAASAASALPAGFVNAAMSA